MKYLIFIFLILSFVLSCAGRAYKPKPQERLIMKCEICGEAMSSDGTTSTTLVGYQSPLGHDHDDNCLTRCYHCPNGHGKTISLRRRCPNLSCDWVGKEKCFCHPGKKVDRWPGELLEQEGR